MINETLLKNAWNATSFSPEKRAEQFKNEFETQYSELVDGMPSEMIERVKSGYWEKVNKYLASKSRIMSPMITGRGNFPVRQQEKYRRWEQSAYERLSQYVEKINKIKNRILHPEARPIMSGDSDALERLKEKLAKLEKFQETMKAGNKLVKSRLSNKITEEEYLKATETIGIVEKHAKELLNPDFCGRRGFLSFELTNNSARMRTIRKRIELLSKQKTKENKVIELGEGVSSEINYLENRIKITYPGKPEVLIRASLKSHGYRWAPSQGVWSAYINHRAMQFVQNNRKETI